MDEKQTNLNNTRKINKVLKGFKKSFKVKLALDVGLFIYFFGIFIYSIVRFVIKQDPLGYNIVFIIVSLIGLAIEFLSLAYRLYKHYTKVEYSVTRKLEEFLVLDEDANTDTLLELAFDVLKESLIYPSIICTMYGFINEKSWQFDNTLAGFHFSIFLFSLCYYDAVYTKLKYIWGVHKAFCSLYDEFDEAIECCLSPLVFTPHTLLLILIHWLILAIIGIRIYVDNFSTEIDQGGMLATGNYPVASYRMNVDNFSTEGNVSETGGYKVIPYTRYMIFCGIYLPVASVVVFIILSRAWFDDEIDSTCEQLFCFFIDPVAYIAAIFSIIPFVAFCVGIFLPDYDSSKFEVDADARNAATILGILFIIAFYCST